MDSNTIEFFVKMKDMMSGGLANIARNSQSAFGKVVQNMKQAHEGSQFLNRSVDQLKTRLKEVNQIRFGTVLKSEFRAANTEAQSLERQIARMSRNRGGLSRLFGGGGLRSAASMLLPVLTTTGLVLGGARFAKGAVNSAMEYELKDKMFQSLTGSRTGGQALTGNLFKLSQQAGFGKDVYQNAQMMLGYGVQGGDVVKDLRQIGAITMGNTLRAKEMTLAYSQTMAAGKLIGKDLRQFVASGFNPLQTISEHWKEFDFKTKKTIGDLQEMMKKGHITADMVKKSFDIATSAGGKFGSTLSAMADTTQGKLQALKGHFEALKISVGNKLQPIVGVAIDTLTGWTDKLTGLFTTAGSGAQNEINKILALQTQLTATNTTHSEQIRLLNDLKDINPDIVKGIDDQAISYSKLKTNIDNVIKSLQAKKAEDMISSDNAKFLANYQKTRTFLDDVYYTQIPSMIAQVNPALASRTDLSFGQKQAMALQEAQAKITDKNPASAQYSDAYRFYHKFRGYVHSYNQVLAGYVGDTPKYRDIQNQLQAYQKAQSFLFPTKKGSTLSESPDSTGIGTGHKTADGITGGGPRVININGVKFADKIEIVHGEFKLGEAELEARLHDMFLRILNSGASIQG